MIHDRTFTDSEIVYSAEEKLLSIPFTYEATVDTEVIRRYPLGLKRVRVPRHLCYLDIASVVAYAVNDQAHTSHHTFDDIHFDPETSTVVVSAIPPFAIEARVDQLNVTVVMTDEIVSSWEGLSRWRSARRRRDLGDESRSWPTSVFDEPRDE